MEWLAQNWIWIAVLIGMVAFLGFFRRSHGGHGGCCGEHGKHPPSDKPGVAHGHQHQA
ncbi:MAG: hypothetical protein K2Y16_11130 [Burkholderiales bacterium]|nr:hypothetical protein [Burkholderiales bacterium]